MLLKKHKESHLSKGNYTENEGKKLKKKMYKIKLFLSICHVPLITDSESERNKIKCRE